MKVELHINGKLCLELTPETDIERLVLMKMREGAEKGKAVTFRGAGLVNREDPNGNCVIEVER